MPSLLPTVRSPLAPQLHQLLDQLVVGDSNRHDATREERLHSQRHGQYLKGVMVVRGAQRVDTLITTQAHSQTN